MRLRFAAALAAALFVASAPSFAAEPQQAQLDESRAAFRKGVDEAQRGDYAAARESFLRAYRLYPHPSILLNLGIARAKVGEFVEAEQDLVRFLADDGGAPPNEVASARNELADVRTHLGTFRLRVAPTGARARLDARALPVLPGSFVDVRAAVGSHALHVEADGYAPVDRDVFVESARVGEIDVTLERSRKRGGGGGGGGGDDDGAERATTGWILLGSGAALAGLGLASGFHSKALADQYNTPGSSAYQDSSTRSTGIAFRTTADVAFVLALAAGGVGVYLLATPPVAAPGTRGARFVVGPHFAGVVGGF